MLTGILFGFGACALWALTYLVPLLLPGYGTMDMTLGRAVVMGLTAVVGLAIHRKWLKTVLLGDWIYASGISVVGNILQPWCLFAAIDYVGVPLAATFFGLIPVLVAVIANERDRKRGKPYLTHKKLFVPLSILLLGLLVANSEDLVASLKDATDALRFGIGCLFATASTALWTWYPIKNADWLQAHSSTSPIFFAEMQSVILIPIGLLGFVANSYFNGQASLLGETPLRFCLVVFVAGFFCSFVSTALWNAMSQRVPTAVTGPMLVFETIFSVAFGLFYEKQWPSIALVVGLILLSVGVLYTLYLFSKVVAGSASQKSLPQ